MFRKGRWILGSNLARSFTRFFSVMILARLLTPDDYGIYSSAFIVLGFASNMSEIGIGKSLIHLQNLDRSHIRTGYSISLVIGLVLSAMVFVGAEGFASFLNVPETANVLKVFALIVPLRSITIVTEGLLRRDLRMKTLAIINYGSMLIGSVLVTIALAWLDFGYWALVLGFLTMHVATAGWLLAKATHEVRLGFSASSARDLLSKGIGFTASRLLNYVAARGDYFVISRYIGTGELGIYNRAYRIMDVSNIIVGRTIDTLLFPVFSKYQGDRDTIRKAHRRSTTLSGLIFLPLSVSGSLLANELVLTVLGAQWVEVGPVLRVLIFGIFFRIGYKFYGSINYAFGHVLATSIFQFIYAVVIIGGAYLVAGTYGILGVAWVVLGALFLEYALQSIHVAVALEERAGKYVRVHLPGVVLAGANFALSVPLLGVLRHLGGTFFVLGLYGVYLSLFYWTMLQLPRSVIGKDLLEARVLLHKKVGSVFRRGTVD